ncbi:hypothetical protein Oweho_1006 [Owenweeksia hongkongensis DSM 17368]|uniref:Ig-like domain-containing protein n=1 Tax=Owenweeksia hongkongensis (strain DSM 17368 / CIP 108786 / JCM 12287 / NRRL B-23963 / UST20020801) TaxID=926562 RepID=G8R3Y4_OWEHD|nr:gliding motility-associated C-terminal domain-containing protein [Owenweeksia hongkongensis]AEV32016.1 hypothetical protein Oweho_1006 [Owenweeksia hongkongensis DSM 17368]
MKLSIIKYSLLILFLILSLRSVGQQVQIQTLTFPSLPATFCTNTLFTVDVLKTCTNITHVRDSIHILGNTIHVYIFYSRNTPCVNQNTPVIEYFSLGKLSKGIHNVTATGLLNGLIVSSASASVLIEGPTANFSPSATNVCVGDSIFYNNNSTGPNTYRWYENGTQVSTQLDYGKLYTLPGNYIIQNVTSDLGCRDTMTHTIHVKDSVPEINFGADTTFCAGAALVLDSGPNRDSVIWSDSSTARTISVTSSGVYHVVVYNDGCQLSDTINVIINKPIVNYLPNDTSACDSIFFDLTNSPLVNFSWSNGSLSSVNKILSSGNVWFTAIDTITGCIISDTSNVTVSNSSSIPSYSKDTSVCGNIFRHDIAVNGGSGYRWFDGSANPVKDFYTSGSFWFEIDHQGGCKSVDTLHLTFVSKQASLVADTSHLCENDSAYVQLISNNYSNILWSNGESANSSYYSNLGKEWVIATDNLGCTYIDTFQIVEAIPTGETYLSDTSVCTGENLVLKAPDGISFIIDNERSKSFTIRSAGSLQIELSNGCTSHKEYIDVSEYNCKCPMVFPDAFTPDRDGLNDYFGPVTTCDFTSFELEIYNRFGQRIFHSKDPNYLFDGTWKGRDLPLAVYVYFFKYSTPYTKGNEQGHVTLGR